MSPSWPSSFLTVGAISIRLKVEGYNVEGKEEERPGWARKDKEWRG
jgi:hypothetical protein